jgi:hypothetical protein
MRSLENIAVDVMRCALAHDAGSRLVGDVTAQELLALAVDRVTTCPLCGSEAWCNIDCDICNIADVARSLRATPMTTRTLSGDSWHRWIRIGTGHAPLSRVAHCPSVVPGVTMCGQRYDRLHPADGVRCCERCLRAVHR